MKVVFLGSGPFGLPSLEALKNSNHQLLAVCVLPDKPQGRSGRVKPGPVKSWAQTAGLTVMEWHKSDADGAIRQILSYQPDILVVIDFGVILPKRLIDAPKHGTLNVHASLLPKYRGAAPIAACILNGDSKTGVTVIRMNERLDAGDIVAQESVPLEPGMDAPAAEELLGRLGERLLIRSLADFEAGRVHFQKQDDSQATLAPKLTKEQGHLDWRRAPMELIRHSLAMKPWPGSFSLYRGKRLIVDQLDCVPPDGLPKAEPGTIVEASAQKGLIIAASGGYLRLSRLQLEGKKLLRDSEFLNGFKMSAGETLQ